MCPEVPIALRMSGHLLLGVVRIYSKKVDYLHHDCNVLWVSLRNAFRPVNVNLPENATHAQMNAVTLPETYQLDAVDIDVDLSLDDDGNQDNHLKSREEITLKDQYPAETELYVRITLDDDITPDLSHSEASPPRETDPMQIDVPPQVLSPGSFADRDPSPNKRSEESHERFGEGSSLPDIPIDFEVMRDCRENDNQILHPDETLAPERNTSPYRTSEKEPDTPLVEHQHILAPEVPLPQSPLHSGPSSCPTNGAPLVSGSFVNVTPEDLSLRPSPTPKKPLRQQRKRKQFFDESLVLTNEFLKNALNDSSNLVKKRKKLPCSALDMWRFMNRKKKENIFLEPLISGTCADLQNLSSKDLVSLNPEPRTPESPAAVPIGGVVTEQVQSPDHDPIPNFSMEPERLRSPDHEHGHHFGPELVSSPLPLTSSHSHGNAQSFSSPGIPGSVSEWSGSAIDTEPHRGMFSSTTGSGMKTPITDFEGGIDDFNTALSDIPELRNSIVSDELSFLEQDNDSSLDSVGVRESDTMSVRTRAVAQYLRDHSPLSKYSDRPNQRLCLNNILEGRSRKLCARMFYETLVLKDYGLIDVEQEEPYGDITLKLSPTFSTAKI